MKSGKGGLHSALPIPPTRISLPHSRAPTLPVPSLPQSQAPTLPIPTLPVPSLPQSQAPTLPIPTLPVPSLPQSQAPTLPVPSLPQSQAPTLPIPTLPIPTLPIPSLPQSQYPILPEIEIPIPFPKIPTVPQVPSIPPKIPVLPPTPSKLPLPPKTPQKVSPPPKIPLPPKTQSQHFPLSRTPSVTAFSLIQSTPEIEIESPSLPPSIPQSIKLPPILPSIPPPIKLPPILPSILSPIKLPPIPPSVKSPPSIKKSQSDDELFSPISSPVGSPKGIYPLAKAPYNPISSIKDFFEDEDEKEERLRKKKEKEEKKKAEEEAEKNRKKEEEKNRVSNLYKQTMDAHRREKIEREKQEEERMKTLQKERQEYIISREMHYRELSNVPQFYFLEKNKKDDSYMTNEQKEIFKVFDHIGWNMDFDSDSVMYVEERKEKSYSYKSDPYIDFMESPVEFRRAFREGKIIKEKTGENEQWITLRLLFDKDKYVDVFWYSSKGITPEKIIDLTSEFYNTPLSYENIKNIYTDEPIRDKSEYYGKLPKNMLSKTHQTEFAGFVPLSNWVFLIKFNIL